MTISEELGITVNDWANDVTDAMRAEAVNVSETHARAAVSQGMSMDAAAEYGSRMATAQLRAQVLRARALATGKVS